MISNENKQAIELLSNSCPQAQSAVERFLRFYDIPTKDRVLSSIIVEIIRLECWDLALRLAEIAALHPNHTMNPFFISHQAQCLIRMNNHGEVIERIDEFLGRVPKEDMDPKSYSYLVIYKSSAYSHLGNLRAAELALKNADLRPNIIEQMVQLAYLQDKHDKVIEICEKHNPAKPKTRIQWARSLKAQGRYGDAIGILNNTPKRTKEADILLEILMEKGTAKPQVLGRKIFLGHGRSSVWIILKDFIQDRLGLEWDEFNREPQAGFSTKERLNNMLDKSGFAFLIMSAEDEHSDGTKHARENVIHEMGLFQGRLGFEKAIALVEEDCSEFTNIVGITQIRFPKGNISASFEEIRRVLEREGII
jgi:predicted nucleotide-binding protein